MRNYDPWSYMPEKRDRDRLAFVDGRKAMSENEAQADAIREKTTRLKALRLAREAAAKVRIPAIVTTRSDGSRPPVPIDRGQSDGAVRCIF